MTNAVESEDFLSERQRAEDILLGNLGYGEEAHIKSVKKSKSGYCGVGVWSDGEEFDFESEEELEDLELWALSILTESKGSAESK